MDDNQHHEDVTQESVRTAIWRFLDQWDRADCQCCAPAILDDALEAFDYATDGPRMRRIGLHLAMTGQNMCDEPIEEASSALNQNEGPTDG